MRLFFIVFFCSLHLSSYGQDTVAVRDLKHGWMGIEPDGKVIPVYDVQDHQAIKLAIPADVKKGLYLRVASPGPIDIWWKGQLLHHQFEASMLLLADTLEDARFMFYADQGIPVGFSIELVKISNAVTLDPIQEKPVQVNAEVYLVIGAFLLLLTAFFRRNFTITFYQSFQNPLSYKIRSISVDQTYVGFGSVDNLYSIFFFSSLFSFLLLYLDLDPMIIEGVSFWSRVANWLVITLLLVTLLVIKFILTKSIALLYQIRELPNIQSQDFIHFFTLVVSLGIAISFIDFSLFHSGSLILQDITLYLVIGSIIFFQVWLYFKLDKFYVVRKLMIISYLCTTEFLPGFLTIYWLTKM